MSGRVVLRSVCIQEQDGHQSIRGLDSTVIVHVVCLRLLQVCDIFGCFRFCFFWRALHPQTEVSPQMEDSPPLSGRQVESGKSRKMQSTQSAQRSSPIVTTTVPGWEAKSTRAECGPLHIHVYGPKHVGGSDARQRHGGPHNTPPILPQGWGSRHGRNLSSGEHVQPGNGGA